MAGKQNPTVQAALSLIDQGMTPYAASKQTGASQASVYSAVKRRQSVRVEPEAVQADAPIHDDPEAALKAMALAGQVEEVGLIVGRLYLFLEDLKSAPKG